MHCYLSTAQVSKLRPRSVRSMAKRKVRDAARAAPCRIVVAIALLAGAPMLSFGADHAERSFPIDCFPDAVERWSAAGPDAGARYGAVNLPGIVLGPPAESSPLVGGTSVASLGPGGEMVYRFDDIVIEDRPGPDFIVFENAFFVGSVPENPGEGFTVFAELGTVEVSSDGLSWQMMPFDQAALDRSRGANIDENQHRELGGLAGSTPTFSGNWTIPDDRFTWDPEGQGGVSGAGGDAFDLADVGMTEARFVRIRDARSENGVPGAADGFDLDTIIVLHGRPVAPAGPDLDGDRLSDREEEVFFASQVDLVDSDADGTDDGREAASCRSPTSAEITPYYVEEPRLYLEGSACTVLRWTWLSETATVQIIRGPLSALFEAAAEISLGTATCLDSQAGGVRWSCDDLSPSLGEGWYYLVRRDTSTHFGRSSSLKPRVPESGCP